MLPLLYRHEATPFTPYVYHVSRYLFSCFRLLPPSPFRRRLACATAHDAYAAVETP